MHDVIVVGGGTCWFNHSDILSQVRCHNLIIDNRRSLFRKTTRIENYLGIEEISRKALLW